MTVVYGTVVAASGSPMSYAQVNITLNRGGITNSQIISHRTAVRADVDGYWEAELIPNSSITPEGTFYVVRHHGVKSFIIVSDSDTPLAISTLLVEVPENPMTTRTYVNDVDGNTGSVSAETIQEIAGTGGGEGGAVTSVEGRIGSVTLDDLYATVDHTHTGYSTTAHHHNSSYAALVHNHDSVYSTLAHDHDADYVQIGNELVTSVNGMTGDVVVEGGGEGGAVLSVDGRDGVVTLDDIYSSVSHDHDADYAGISHTHDYPVDSVDGQTGVVDLSAVYSAIAHDHDADYSGVDHTHDYPVDSVDGQTGAVDLSAVYSAASHNHDADYVQIGNELVTSVNGMTGDVVVSGGGESAVLSVDGRDGVVTLDDLYAAAVHNHDLAYAPLVHNHDADYADIAHTHTGVYATAAHNHDADYADIAHHHDLVYAALDHNHDADYAAIDHNHTGVYVTPAEADADYAALGHNHDAAYSALGHTHNITECFTFSHQGTLTTGTGTSRKYMQYAGTIVAVRLSVGTAPTGASVTVDVNNGTTTVFTTQSNRPSISASAFTGSTTSVQDGSFAAGDYIRVDIDAIGSTIAGSDLVVDVYYRRAQ